MVWCTFARSFARKTPEIVRFRVFLRVLRVERPSHIQPEDGASSKHPPRLSGALFSQQFFHDRQRQSGSDSRAGLQSLQLVPSADPTGVHAKRPYRHRPTQTTEVGGSDRQIRKVRVLQAVQPLSIQDPVLRNAFQHWKTLSAVGMSASTVHLDSFKTTSAPPRG